MAVETVRKGAPKPFRFLDLPRELRDQVYRELLCSGKVHEPVNQVGIARRYRYQVAILRCNRQTNIEATPILYGDNLFILFELDWLITTPQLYDLTRPSVTLFTGPSQRKALRKKVAVKIRLSEHDEPYTAGAGKRPHGDKFIITPWELVTTAQMLSMPYRLRQAGPPWDAMPMWPWTLFITLNLRHKHEKQLDTIREAVLALGGLCNIRKVYKSRSSGSVFLDPLPVIRSHPYSIDECLAWASVLEDRGDRCLMSRDPSQEFFAYKCYYEGLKYLAGVPMGHLTGSTPEKYALLRGKCIWMNMACALYLVNHGQDDGKELLKRWHPLVRQGGPKVVAKIFFYQSCSLLQRSHDANAIYFLWKALLAWPGWPIALEALTEIEKRRQLEPALKAKTPDPFHPLLQPIRRQLSRPMTKEEGRVVDIAILEEFKKTNTTTMAAAFIGV